MLTTYLCCCEKYDKNSQILLWSRTFLNQLSVAIKTTQDSNLELVPPREGLNKVYASLAFLPVTPFEAYLYDVLALLYA